MKIEANNYHEQSSSDRISDYGARLNVSESAYRNPTGWQVLFQTDDGLNYKPKEKTASSDISARGAPK